MTTLNDAVHWSAELGGGTRVALIQAGTLPLGRRGAARRRAADDVEPARRRRDRRRSPAAAGAQLPADRDAVRAGPGRDRDRGSDRREGPRRCGGYEGPWILPALETAGFAPDTVDVVAVSHLHYDHAGGVLRPDGSRAFPRARFVAQLAEWQIALGENPRLVASYDQPELRLVRDLGAAGAVDGEAEILPGVSRDPDRRPLGRPPGSGRSRPRRTVAFFGDLCMRPWSANPKWVTAFDDFPLDSVAVKASLFARAADEGWTIVLSHEPVHPVGRLVRDRDRFRFEPRV